MLASSFLLLQPLIFLTWLSLRALLVWKQSESSDCIHYVETATLTGDNNNNDNNDNINNNHNNNDAVKATGMWWFMPGILMFHCRINAYRWKRFIYYTFEFAEVTWDVTDWHIWAAHGSNKQLICLMTSRTCTEKRLIASELWVCLVSALLPCWCLGGKKENTLKMSEFSWTFIKVIMKQPKALHHHKRAFTEQLPQHVHGVFPRTGH